MKIAKYRAYLRIERYFDDQSEANDFAVELEKDGWVVRLRRVPRGSDGWYVVTGRA